MSLPVIFFALLAVVFGAILLWMRPTRDAETLYERLDDLYQGRREQSEASAALRIAENAGEAVHGLQRALRHEWFDGLRTLLQHSQSSLTPATFFLRSIIAGLGLAFVAGVAMPLLLVRVAAFAAGVALPTLWLQYKSKKRLKLFDDALPDAVDLISRALRAGHSVQQALEIVATDSKGPIAEEFRQLHQELKFGVTLKESLRALAARMPSADLQFVVTAIIVQKETGGDLIEILERTTFIIRDRLRVGREVMTYTAQGRMTGWILSALPVFLLAAISVITPSYSTVLFHDPMGQKLLVAAAALIGLGSFVIRRVVRVEV